MPALIRHLGNHMGAAFEASFHEHLWRPALAGELGGDVVEIGPWRDNQDQRETSAVVLAEPEMTRVPALIGESKWNRTADGKRIEWAMDGKAGALGADPSGIRHAICARSEVRDPRPGTLVVTAEDVFAPQS